MLADFIDLGDHVLAIHEDLLVLVGFLALLVALGALWHVGSGGGLVRLSVDAASHGYGQGAVPLLKDVLGY